MNIILFHFLYFSSGRTEKELAASEPPRSPQPVRRTKSQRQERRQIKTDSSPAKKLIASPSDMATAGINCIHILFVYFMYARLNKILKCLGGQTY